eukprot:3034306-Rhodomonas_salina.1
MAATNSTSLIISISIISIRVRACSATRSEGQVRAVLYLARKVPAHRCGKPARVVLDGVQRGCGSEQGLAGPTCV